MNLLIFIIIVSAVILWFFHSKQDQGSINIHTETRNGFSGDVKPRSYDGLDEWKSDLITLWNGPPLDIEFTYESRKGKLRRNVTLKKVAKNSRHELYLIGTCHTRGEDRTFNIENIVTMVKYKSKRYHHYDFISDVVGIDASGYAFSC